MVGAFCACPKDDYLVVSFSAKQEMLETYFEVASG